MEFTDFKLHSDLQKGIDEAGYKTCMPVQEQVLSHAFGGQGQDCNASQDLYVQSQTGTGKTAAFLIVIFQRMLTEEPLFKRKALIMAPTRELAVQIEEEAKMLGKYLPFKTGSFYGGIGYTQQEKLLRENAQILVGTPGRVLDLNKSGRMNLMEISFLILDEADRMFDMGFYPDLRKLIKVVPHTDRRQTMLFSATLNSWVKNLAWEYTKSPFEIEIKPEIVTVEEITQILYHASSEEKMPLLLGILKHEQPQSAVIFCNTKKHTEIIAKRLKLNGYDCEFIIGDLPQVKRLKIIDDVKAGKIKILAATDVAARGLDIENLAMVINYDLPSEAENYVHRIGRTARAGKTGKAFSLASEHDVYELPAIERYIGKKIPSEIPCRELYAEDKSANHHIQTDYYEERRQDRRDARKGTAGKTSFRNRRETSHEQAGQINKSARRRLNKSLSSNKEHQSEEAQFNKSGEKPVRHDLSQLSMEERMVFYRKKYTGQETKQWKAGNEQHGKLVKHRHEIKHKENQNENQTEPDVPVKKSLLSKLIGIFK
jgi:ATP-dependent RNA helicase RhlB